ncbi:MAG: hypothetical protein GY936_18150 [Ignavibacteriae bacterium]|nr:hypothetical protein [Ignavibacteriota bacterium]
MILTKEKIESLNIVELVDDKIKNDTVHSLLIIVPTNRKLRQLKKIIISSFDNKPVTKINIETLTTLTTKINNFHKPFIPLSEATSSVLIKQSVDELELKYFATYSLGVPFGTLDKIKNVISEYKRHGISASKLLEESNKLEGSEKSKAEDIASVYELYNKKCNNLSAEELGDIYSDVLQLNSNDFTESFNNYFPTVETIILNEFDEFTSPEVKIINKLSELPEKKVFLSFDYYNYNPSLFSHLDESYTKLEDYGFNRIVDSAPTETSEFKNLVRSNLFQPKQNIKQNDNYKNKVYKIELQNRIDEIEFIAKKIKELVLLDNVNPENICVAFNIVGNYSNNIRDIFNKYSIPLNLTDRIQLKTSPPVVAAISLLELIEHDFYYNDIARVLTNGFINIKNVDLSNLLTVASELKIISSKSDWEILINDALALLSYNKELTKYERDKEKQKLFKAKNDIIYLDKLLSPLHKKNTIDEFLKNFKKLLLELKLPCKLLDNSFGKEEEYIKSVTVLMQTLTEVLTFIKLEEGDQKYSVNYFIEQIKTIANWARFNVKEKTDQGVLVTSVNEIRGLKFDYLFLGGLCDGDFPTKYQPEIFFSGSFQKKELVHQTEERYHFYQVLSSWNKRLYLTIPKHDADAELVTSTFVKDLEKIVSLTHLENFTHNQIYSKEELLIEFGKNVRNEKLQKETQNINLELEKLLKTNRIGVKRSSEPFKNNIYSGFIQNDNTNENINNYLEAFLNKEFSSSQLETFAKCPFKYLSEKILKLKPIAEPTEDAEPIELGNVLHSILYEFYTKIRNDKIEINKVGTEEFAKLQKLLFEIAEAKIEKLNLHSPLAFFEKEKILGIDGVKENSILNKFLLEEQKQDSDFTPFYFEYPFGTFTRDEDDAPKIPPLQIGKLKLRGKIDRIDVDVENNRFNIVDYKLKGKKPTLSELQKGISLQLMVYLMAGKHIIKDVDEKDYEGLKMFIYSLSYNEKNFGNKPVNLTRKKLTEESIIELNGEQIETTKQHLEKYYDKIGKGEFHLSEFEDRENLVCRFCDFKSLCRVQEVFE